MFTTEKAPGELHEWSSRELEREGLAPWRKLMLDSADYIEKHGLHRGSLTDDNGKFCTIGTLRYIDSGCVEGKFHGTPAGDAWHVLMPVVGGLVSDWSDKTPQDEVVATLRRVALGGL